MPAAIIAGAAIAGTAAVASSVIASSGAKKAAETQAQAQQQAIASQEKAAAEAQAERERAEQIKRQAVENIEFPTFLSTPEGQELRTTLQDRIAGRGLIDVNAQTAPVANQIRAGLKNTEAAIGSAASARGLGRSTIPVNQIGEASQAAERDIAERVKQLELARQQQIEDAIGRFQRLSEQEASSQQNRALFERGGEFGIADTVSGSAESAKQDQFSIAKAIEVKGATEASGELLQSQMIASGILSAGLSIQEATKKSSEDIIDAISKEQTNRSGALVNVGGRSIQRNVNTGSNILGG